VQYRTYTVLSRTVPYRTTGPTPGKVQFSLVHDSGSVPGTHSSGKLQGTHQRYSSVHVSGRYVPTTLKGELQVQFNSVLVALRRLFHQTAPPGPIIDFQGPFRIFIHEDIQFRNRLPGVPYTGESRLPCV